MGTAKVRIFGRISQDSLRLLICIEETVYLICKFRRYLIDMKIGIVCYPTFGGSGVIATELGKALAENGHQVHFITYSQPVRLDFFSENLFYHEVAVFDYPLFEYSPYETALT